MTRIVTAIALGLRIDFANRARFILSVVKALVILYAAIDSCGEGYSISLQQQHETRFELNACGLELGNAFLRCNFGCYLSRDPSRAC